MENKKKAIIIAIIAVVLFVAVTIIFLNKSTTDKEGIQKSNVSAVEESILEDLKNNRFNDALVNVDNLLLNDSENTDLLLLKAEILLSKGSTQFIEQESAIEAQKIINSVLEKESDNVRAYKLLGYSYEIQNMFNDALVNYDKSLTLRKTSDVYNWKGHVYDLMGDIDKAEEFYTKALEIDENNRMALRNLARINWQLDKKEETREILQKLIKMPVDNISAVAADHHSLGNVEFDDGRIDESKVLFEKALKIDPSFMLAQVELEKYKILFENNKDDAIVNLGRISQSNPKQVFPLEWLGFAYLENNEIDNSIKYLNKAIELIPSDITLMPQQRTTTRSRLNYYLSIAYSLNGDIENSKSHLLKTMEGMNESTMIMLVNALQKGENGPYKNIIHDEGVAKLSEELSK